MTCIKGMEKAFIVHLWFKNIAGLAFACHE
jgi:hypothetical protein